MSCQDDFVPPAYMRWVKDTQDKVPSEFPGRDARDYVTAVLLDEQNKHFDDIFSEWDDEPLGVASIGQVHRAVLRKTGEVVAVKFLVPGIETKFRSDIHTLKAFCQLAMPQHVSAFDEIEKQFCTEFDYVAEGRHLQTIADLISPKWSKEVVIPRPKMEHCSKTVLVMEFLEGKKLVDGIREQYKVLAENEGRSFDEMLAEQKAAMAAGTFKFKSIGASRAERRWLEWYLLLKDAVRPVNLSRFAWNNTLGWFLGFAKYEKSVLPVDLGHMLEVLAHVHADQIFEHGIFNGDPHPGNILLLKDGRLGLIDYGQVKRMTLPQRLIYARLIVAHASDDKSEVVHIHFKEMGNVTRNMRADIGYLMNAFYHDRDTPDILQGHNIATFVDWLEAEDPMIMLASDYLFAARVSIMLRGMAKAFGLQVKMSTMWEKEARDLLHKHGIYHMLSIPGKRM